jgi:ABC-type antimicrobial peptide transport system permease subunit
MNLESFSAFRLRIRALLHRGRLNRDIDDELQFHLAARASRYREAGVEPGEAERLSQLKFGNPTSFQEVLRDMWTFRWLEIMLQDIHYAARTLARSPGFSAATILTLALGIGSSTAIFSVVNAVLLRSLPFKNPGQLYRLRTMSAQGLPTGLVGPRHVLPLTQDHPSIEAAALGFAFESSLVMSDGRAIALNEHRVSQQFFEVFNNPMAIGRNFKPEESFDRIVLSYRIWQDVFHSDRKILGSVIRVSGTPLTVVGVAAPGFDFPNHTQVWTRMYLIPGSNILTNMEGYVRLRPGYSEDQLKAELAVLAPRIEREPDNHKVEFVVRPLLDDVVGDLKPTVLILSGSMAILLLIACLNVANLLFARGASRLREIAMRRALGASRRRVIGQLMTESLVLCLVGGCLGLGLAFALIRALPSIAPADLPRLDTVSVDHTVFIFAAACVLFTTLVVGLAPALRIARGDLTALIQDGGRSSSVGRGQNRIFGSLVIAEIALAIVLVIGAGLLVRSYARLIATDPGFKPDRMLTLTMTPQGRIDLRVVLDKEGKPIRDSHGNFQLTGTGYLPMARFYQQLIRRIQALPGVEAVTASSSAPLVPEQLSWDGGFLFGIAGEPSTNSNAGGHSSAAHKVTPEFFETMGTRLLAGRFIEPTDTRYTRGVAVINQALAQAYFPGQNPLGHSLILSEAAVAAAKPGGIAFLLGDVSVDQAEIVGVVSNIKDAALSEPAGPAIYFPHEQLTARRMVVIIRTAFDQPGKLIPAIRHELAEMDPTIPPQFDIYSDVIAGTLSRQRLATVLLGAFGLLALILAAVGIYGVMSYSVAQRSAEIAVRAAMGASPSEVLRLIMRRALELAGAGIVLGVLGAVALRQVVASQLYEVSALDPRVFVLVPLALLGVALLASCLPAWRAARIDPAIILRTN